MMKLISVTLLAFVLISGSAQSLLIPGKNSFERKWLKNESYEMIWYLLKDTMKIDIGKVTTHISIDEKVLTMITKVSMNNVTSSWIDSTLADITTLKPIRHSSFNKQRDMVLNFGHVVTGFYHDKVKDQNTVIRDMVAVDYFDSNLYPILIRWLPLKEGYKKNIAIYDYNPSARIGVMNAGIQKVTEGTYRSIKTGVKEVWIVTVADEISNGVATYYIDKQDRTLWKQEMNTGGRTMLMIRIE
ncbi:MAG TPA: hypothetical protein PKJ83_05845 [Cyclobacteriaceae bacterium]|nr:hypothetical protein [Cyclobacteriaceae bacterium]